MPVNKNITEMKNISILFENLSLVEPYLSRFQVELVKDLRSVYKLKGYLTEEQLTTLTKLWQTAIMAGGDTDD